MHKLSLVLGLLASVTPSLAAVATPFVEVQKYDGEVNKGSYIVRVRDGVPKSGVISRIGNLLDGDTKVTHDWDPEFFNGFAGKFSDNVIEVLESSIEVEYIAEDGIMTTSDVQNDAPWGLARVSTRKKLAKQDPFALDYQYQYLSNPGVGVDIYVVDTGIFIDHPDFEGRARWGGVFCQECAEADGNGHGTHVAGTAGGRRSGIAKAANLIAVKVLSDKGSGSVSDIISGLQWIKAQHQASGRPSIATMSLGGSVSFPLDEAVRQLIRSGIHCTVAAGNSNTDAALTSPANTPGAITVAASDITDSRAYYSNYGRVVSVFAPGSNITSTWIDGSYHTISGTSMATPHVAGLVAYFLNIIGPDASPATMSGYIKRVATKGALSNVPLLTSNYLVYNNIV
ncbi:serine protease [Thelephora ganbajun]|uniref:Serine protease n=1 Tax=Thelephora ganbajun TaxID=370292 RepID=A0ACB6ZQU7_THEGA|nr:serine protease [Thelephora ganbajun]